MPDIGISRQTVAVSNYLECPLLSTLGYMELGPDGRLYVHTLAGGNGCMHRIKSPEKAGLACEVQQQYLQFQGYYYYSHFPHFPNFRLGPIDSSSCDTLGLDNHPLAGWRYDKAGGTDVDFTSVSWYEPDTWWWDFGDPASGAANQTSELNPAYNFSAPGAYEVCLTVSNQHGSDTKCKWVWVSTVGTDSPVGEENQITIFPNPTTGMVHWSGILEGEAITVRVHDALGRLCFERQTMEHSTDLGGLPNGVYFVSLLNRDATLLTTKAVILTK